MGELQAHAARISKVESSIDLGTLQKAVETAVSERVNERLGELAAGICALRDDLQKASEVQQGPEVMSTLREDSGQELFFRLEEAMECEKQSRLKFEDAVMTRLSERCMMCSSQPPQVLQELRAQIQASQEDLREAAVLNWRNQLPLWLPRCAAFYRIALWDCHRLARFQPPLACPVQIRVKPLQLFQKARG